MSIRINCSIVSGPHKGGKAWLSSGQEITIGRTEAADFCFGYDAQMSSVHLKLRIDGERCILQDLQSTNGTFVGGQRVAEIALDDGDEFQAGQCVFAVEVSESAAQKSHSSSLDASDPMADVGSHHAPIDIPERIPAEGSLPDQARQPDFLLHIQPHGDAAETIELVNGQSLVIGRTTAANHVIPIDPELSSLHFELAIDEGICFVRDLSSSNGTFVNEVRVTRQPVNSGDIIRAGRSTFQLAIPEPMRPAASLDQVAVPMSQIADANADKTPETDNDATTDFENAASTTASESAAVRSAAEPPEPAPEAVASPPPEGGNVQLTYRIRENDPQVLWLRDGQTIVVGSDESADHVVHGDPQLAAKHFELIADADACVLRDLGSSKGTFVNGEPTAGQVLSTGDTIAAGTTTFQVTIHAVPQFGSPAARPVPQAAPLPSEVPSPIDDAIVDESANLSPADEHTGVAKSAEKSPQPSYQKSQKRSTDADGQINVTIHAPDAEPRVVWLRDGQQAVFGRSQEADVWVETDPQLSSRHFEIISEGGACAIRDLESQNGTFVNGATVTFEVLCNGDVIQAGDTRFVVATNAAPESPDRAAPASWQRTDCPSGICAFVGTLGPIQTLMSTFRGAWYVVNVPELGEHPLPQPRWLYSWLPSNVARDLSPAILAGDDAESCPALLDEAAQKQAVFGVVSDCGAAELGMHLIAVARGQKRLTGMPQAELMFANHSFAALEQLFRTCDPEYADFVFSKVQALVFPIDDGNQSVVLAPPAFEQQLETAAPRSSTPSF